MRVHMWETGSIAPAATWMRVGRRMHLPGWESGAGHPGLHLVAFEGCPDRRRGERPWVRARQGGSAGRSESRRSDLREDMRGMPRSRWPGASGTERRISVPGTVGPEIIQHRSRHGSAEQRGRLRQDQHAPGSGKYVERWRRARCGCVFHEAAPPGLCRKVARLAEGWQAE